MRKKVPPRHTHQLKNRSKQNPKTKRGAALDLVSSLPRWKIKLCSANRAAHCVLPRQKPPGPQIEFKAAASGGGPVTTYRPPSVPAFSIVLCGAGGSAAERRAVPAEAVPLGPPRGLLGLGQSQGQSSRGETSRLRGNKTTCKGLTFSVASKPQSRFRRRELAELAKLASAWRSHDLD